MKSSNYSQQRVGRASFLGRKVDLLDHYEKKLEHLEDSVRMEQSLVTGKVCIISYFKHYFLNFGIFFMERWQVTDTCLLPVKMSVIDVRIVYQP